MAKIWRRVGKMRGVHQNNKPPYLIKDNRHITEPSQVAEAMASHYQNISSNNSYSNKFQSIKRTQEQNLNFTTRQDYPYNFPISLLELRRMLSLCSNTATGEDRISYTMISKLHKTCQLFLLAIMNLSLIHI